MCFICLILSFYTSILNICAMNNVGSSCWTQLKNRVQCIISLFSCGLWSWPVIIELWSKSKWITLKLQHQRQKPILNPNFLFLLMIKRGICQLKVIFRFCLFPVPWLNKSCMGKRWHQDRGRRCFPSWSSLIQDGNWDEKREVDFSCWAL